MDVKQGDRITVESNKVGAAPRTGKVTEVITGATGDTHLRVLWDDGHESTYFPSSDAHRSSSN